jgi:hypothetical protein
MKRTESKDSGVVREAERGWKGGVYEMERREGAKETTRKGRLQGATPTLYHK